MTAPKSKNGQLPSSVGIWGYIDDIGEPVIQDTFLGICVEKLTFSATNLIVKIDREITRNALRNGEDSIAIDAFNQMKDMMQRNREGLTTSQEFLSGTGNGTPRTDEENLDAMLTARHRFIEEMTTVRSGIEGRKQHTVLDNDLFDMEKRITEQTKWLRKNVALATKADCDLLGCTPEQLKAERNGQTVATHFMNIVTPKILETFALYYNIKGCADMDQQFDELDALTRHTIVNNLYSSLSHFKLFNETEILTGGQWGDREKLSVQARELELLRPFIDDYLTFGEEELKGISHNLMPTEDIDHMIEKKKRSQAAARQARRDAGNAAPEAAAA